MEKFDTISHPPFLRFERFELYARCEGGISRCATQNWVHTFDNYLDDEQEYCSLNIFKARSEKLNLMGPRGTYQVCTFYFQEAGKWNVA